MSARQYSSTVKAQSLGSTLAAGTTYTSMVLSTSGTTDPTLSLPTSYPYTLVIDPDLSTEEIVTVNSKIGSTYSVDRAQDGTSAVEHTAGSVVKHMITARDLQEPQDHMVATIAHGATGAVVGTTNSQVLTNKRLNSPKLNEDVLLTSTSTELNVLDGITSTTAELNILDGVTANAIEINVLDGITATTAELNILHGVTATTTELNKLHTTTVSTAELNYVTGVTSAIQTQLGTKAPLAGPTFTGTVTLPSTTSIGNVSSTELGYLDGVTSSIQTQFSALEVFPKGMITPFAGSNAPTGWLLCDGSPKSKTTYADLYTAIGVDAFGTDTSTDFYLPDLRGRVIAGVDNMGGTDASRLDWANTIGTTGGSQTHTLTTTEMPAHRHSWSYNDAVSNTGDGAASGARWDNSSDTAESQYTINTTYVGGQTPGSAGTTAAHNNMQPTMLLNYIIKY